MPSDGWESDAPAAHVQIWEEANLQGNQWQTGKTNGILNAREFALLTSHRPVMRNVRREMCLTLYCIAIVAFACYLGRSIWNMSQRSSAVKRRAANVFTGRALLTRDQFSELFPTDLRQIAGSIREMLQSVLIVDVRCVRPQDRLIADLGLGRVDGLDAYHLDGDIESRYQLSILGLFEHLGDPTVNDVVRYVAQRIE